jgi:hypothetical protein
MQRCASLLAGVVLLLSGVACGGGEGSVWPGSGEEAPAVVGGLRPVEVMAAEALALFDDQLGVTAVALLAAADRGYSPAQIDWAVKVRALTEAGGVVTKRGEVVAPEWPAEDFIQGKPLVVAVDGEEGASAGVRGGVELVAYVVGGADPEPSVTFQGLRSSIEGDAWAALETAEFAGSVTTKTSPAELSADQAALRSLAAIGMIVDLHRKGYTVEQIILGVVGGLVRWDGELDPYIVGERPGGRSAPGDQTATDPPSGDVATVLDGTYRGPVDLVEFFRRFGGDEIADVLRVWENEITAQFAGGQLISLSGSARSYYPEIIRDDGGTCSQDSWWTFLGEPAEFALTSDGFQVPIHVRQVSTATCEGWSDYEEDESFVVRGSGQLDTDGAIRLAFDFGLPEPLLAILRRA